MDKLKLAAIGDSLTQGFQSGAVELSKIEWSTPAIIARALGLDVPLDFRVPRIPGRGLPINLEDLLHEVARRLGTGVSDAEWIFRFPWIARRYLDEIEDYYERGGGKLPPKFRGYYHNLAVWGFTVRESLSLTPQRCRAMIDEDEGFIDDDFVGIPSAPMYRTALRVLNPGNVAERMADSQIATFERLAASERVDVLLLGLGANDCLGTVLTLELKDMEKAKGPIPTDPVKRLAWNLTSEEQFALDYRELTQRIALALRGQHTKVFVSTVPHVTIPPITSGIGRFDGTYFEAYARFFVHDGNKPARVEHLTREQARTIDARIDGFNRIIRAEADVHGFHVVDLCGLLDCLAVKRQQLKAAASVAGQALDPELPLKQYLQQTPDHPLLALDPVPSILSLRLDRAGRRVQGGLFSLDGVHPSTIGYGLIAELYLKEMKNAGVRGADPEKLPWAQVIANDSLLQAPPRLWDDVFAAAEQHAWLWNLVFRSIA